MDRQTSAPEELEPLEPTKLRDLEVVRDADDEGRPGYIVSASAVVRRADHVYVVGDDELDLAVFRSSESGPGELRRRSPATCPTPTTSAPARSPTSRRCRCCRHSRGRLSAACSGWARARDPVATAASTGRSTPPARSRATR